jgi:hypothetical protein
MGRGEPLVTQACGTPKAILLLNPPCANGTLHRSTKCCALFVRRAEMRNYGPAIAGRGRQPRRVRRSPRVCRRSSVRAVMAHWPRRYPPYCGRACHSAWCRSAWCRSAPGNVWARELGLPLDPVRAIAAQLAHPPHMVDVGCANGRPFLSIASAGFATWSGFGLSHRVKRCPFRATAMYGAPRPSRWRSCREGCSPWLVQIQATPA